jgi:hypothetical protein
MNDVSKYKNPLLYVVAAVLGLLSIYAIWMHFNRNEKMPVDLEAKIDSLENVNQNLIEQQHKIDSSISSYAAKISAVDFQIGKTKEKSTIINQFHRDAKHQVDNIQASELDSFFKKRYHY